MTRIQLPESSRNAAITLLNASTTELTDLSIQAKLAHWNVRGPHFLMYHQLFDQVAEHAREGSDSTAERVAALGGVAGLPVQDIATTSPLPTWPMTLRAEAKVLAALADRLGIVANHVRERIDQAALAEDADTADLLTELSRILDQDLWMLEAHEPA